MATLNIEGRRVTVDDAFLKLSPEDQQATVDEIASSLPTIRPPDKYEQAAIDEDKRLKEMGAPDTQGLTRRLVHGATLGADNTLVAAATTPLEMIRQGTWDPREGYAYAKAREDYNLDQARKKTGALGTAAELLGGGVAGGGLASGGVTASRFLAPNAGLLGRTAASALDSTALGGVAGFNEGNSLSDRLSNAGQGAVLGAAAGTAFPVLATIAGGIAAPIVSNIAARSNPQGYAERQAARAIAESGKSVKEIGADIRKAAREGQSGYTLADAIGNPGQRMLSTVARAPGEGRTAVVNFLEGRQGTQGRRVSRALAEGFDAPETAAQTERRLTAARDTAADAEYSAVRNDAKPVDLTDAIAYADDTLSPGVNQIARPQSGIADDSVEAALQKYRSRLTDDKSMLTDFTAVQRVRGDLSDAVQRARAAKEGNKARLLGGLLQRIDAAMEQASAGHKAANANFAQASRNIDAIDQGRIAATRGRTEDTIPAFESLTPEGQQAFRSGYVDPLIAQAQGAAFGVNKARPLLRDAFHDEAAAMAPGNDLMQRRLTREQTMFETRNHAIGGSRTADNLADADAAGIDPTVVGHILSGNYLGAVTAAIHAGSRAITGNTPEVRNALAKILLQRGAKLTTTSLDAMVGETLARIQFVQNLARGLGRAGAGALAVAPNTQRKK